jgi:cytochrome P450
MTATSDAFWITRNPVGRGRDWLQSQRRIDAPRPPGPRGRPFVGVLPDYQADPFGYLRQLGDVYGDIYRLPLPLYDVVVVNHPDHVGHILNSRKGEYATVGSLAGFVKTVGGASLAMMQGDKIRQRRKLLTPMISRRQLTKIASCVADEFAKRLTRWDRFAESGEPIDLQQELSAVVMPAFMRAMFSLELPDADAHQLDADVHASLATFTNTSIFLGPIPRLLPGDGNPVQAWMRVRQWAKRRLDERLADRPYDDMMQVILDAHRHDGAPINRRDAIAEITTLLLGGWESVAGALAWTLGLLPQNPQAQQRLYDEADGLGGAVPAFDDLDRLHWAKACFEEGQRLRGFPFLLRVAMADDTIGGYRIRRGTLVATSPYAIHHDSRWWGPDTDTYDPMRFYDKDIVAARPNLAFIPFGAGPLRCIGAAMGDMSAQFLLAQIHQRFRLQTPAGWVARYDPAQPLPVKGGVPVVLTKVPTAAN